MRNLRGVVCTAFLLGGCWYADLAEKLGDTICAAASFGLVSDCDSVPDAAIYPAVPTGGFAESEVVAFLLPTSRTETLSDSSRGDGPDFEWAYGIVVDASNGRALVADRDTTWLFAVDLATGDRTLLSGHVHGSGTRLIQPGPIDLDPARNRVYVSDFGQAVVAIDLASGDRATVTGAGVGSGPAIKPNWIVFDPAADRLLVTDFETAALFAIDPVTGARALVSGPSRGNGPIFTGPRQIALDPLTGVLYLVDSLEKALFAIDLSTGDRSIVSGGAAGAGVPFENPRLLIHDAGGARVLVMDSEYDDLIAVDLGTGARTILAGDGPATEDTWGMALDAGRNRILLTRK